MVCAHLMRVLCPTCSCSYPRAYTPRHCTAEMRKLHEENRNIKEVLPASRTRMLVPESLLR